MLAGSLIGGIKETQDMLDFCGRHNIVSDIEVKGFFFGAALAVVVVVVVVATEKASEAGGIFVVAPPII